MAKGPVTGTSVSNTTITQGAEVPTNEHRERAITAIANAAAENARAIAQCAQALKGPSHTFGPGISIG